MMSDSVLPGEEVELKSNQSPQEINNIDNPKDIGEGQALGGEDSDETEGPTSSVGNIIPMDKLKNGWFALSTFMTAQACAAREKAIELNNSEAVQNMRKRTSETIGPAWEKSVEVATPYWEKTKEVTTPYVEKTKENAALLSEAMKPRVEAAMKTVSEAAVSAAEYTTEMVTKVAGRPSSSDSGNFSSGGSNMVV